MKTEEVLALGKFTPDDLVISVSESNRKIDPAIESQIDALWEAKKKQAEAEGRVCYNGISYRLNSLELKEGKVVIDFGLLEFKAREMLRTIPGYYELPDEYYHKGCYSGATVKTSDNKYLMVELSGKSMNENATDLLGGIMEKPMEIANGEDVFECLYAELEEEGRITKADIREIYLRAISQTAKTHVSFYYEVILNISSDEILRRFANETRDQDIKSLTAFSREEYLSLLQNHAAPAKQIIAEFLQI